MELCPYIFDCGTTSPSTRQRKNTFSVIVTFQSLAYEPEAACLKLGVWRGPVFRARGNFVRLSKILKFLYKKICGLLGTKGRGPKVILT